MIGGLVAGEVESVPGARLLEELEAVVAQGHEDLRLLASPARVVVPSRMLREHLAATLLRRAGRSLAGLEISTHRALAFRTLEAAGESAPRGEAFLAVLVRRHARRERALRQKLDGLEDGYGVVVAAVRDLLDAGFEPEAHAPAIDEWLQEQGRGAAVERARAAVRIASRTSRELAERGLADPSTLLRRATALLQRHGAALLPTRALWIHGFADATGVVADWLETLLRVLGGRVILSRPRVPGEGAAIERRFSRRFYERFAAAGVACEDPAPPAAALRVVRAAGSDAELRAVGVRIRALLDAGARPEGIGVVGRALEAFRPALRVQFERLGIPFTAPSLRAVGSPGVRRVEALLGLLVQGRDAPVERWLDAHAPEPGPPLRTALHAVGAARLGDLADLDLDERLGESDLRLPVPIGLAPAEDTRPGRAERLRRVHFGRGDLEAWRQRAGRFAARLDEARRSAALPVHADGFLALACQLGWRDDADFTVVEHAVRELGAQLEGVPELEAEEWQLLLRHALLPAVAPPAGGCGGGVQVLTVMEARGLDFEHLFVIGLNRDVFPRPVVEDPVIPDALRRGLRVLLPELPVKAEGHDEERHHFAQLVAASPDVTLSWQFVSDDGRERVPSPFLVRLELAAGLQGSERAPSLLTPGSAEQPRPAHEHAALVAVHGSRRDLGRVLPAALAEVARELGSEEADDQALSRVRIAVLDELDPPPRSGRSLAPGPFFGFVGPRPLRPARPAPDLFITHVQSLARCPWQHFLERLGLEPAPDALEALPTLDRRRLGSVVHAVLEEIVKRRWPEVPRALDQAARVAPVAVPWPDPATLEGLVLDATWQCLREDGLPARELAQLLAYRARGILEEARRVEWGEGALGVVGVEVEGAFEVVDGAGRPRRVGFRADRADRREERLRLTDYKTGPPIHSGVKPDTRRKNFLGRVARGRDLQAAAYVEGARALGLAAEGRFAFVREDLDPELRVWTVGSDEHDFRTLLDHVCRVALDALDAGAAFPRLVDEKDRENRLCLSCEVRDACLQGETVHRRRLLAWLDGDPEGASLPGWRALWNLGRARSEPER